MAMLMVWFCSKEPRDREEHQTFRDHIAWLFEQDGWAFSLSFIITLGGVAGLANFLWPWSSTRAAASRPTARVSRLSTSGRGEGVFLRQATALRQPRAHHRAADSPAWCRQRG
jgi:NNP family nitrate/nitrite transporter-like MFS transporter